MIDFEKLGYDTKNMHAYFKFSEASYYLHSNGYHEAYHRVIAHTFKDSNKMFLSTLFFPFESVNLIHFEARVKGMDCEPGFSYTKSAVKYQYIMGVSFNCKEVIPKGSDVEVYFHFKLMDWVLNSKEKILDVLREIYGDTYIASMLYVTNITPILEYAVNMNYPGFKIKKSLKVVADKVDMFGKPLSVISTEEVPHEEDSVTANWSSLIPNKTYVLINYLE
ncbi:hypothetical protein [Stygiolobus caldivivus]|uniref:Uncharacterized protein n=1 Tax=Stygiolobus caldivivus TaxID=2824673 RepID=A0A8D5U6J3_9CREN|nr:hypothetical protein [Stygiolobus caldivivus]BCU69995.1 hypothetical protein KN1_12920 [Stygiolobus caldivivus]